MKLEKIFPFNKYEFVDFKKNKVNPKPVGSPIIITRKIGDITNETFVAMNFIDKVYTKEEINAYLMGQVEVNGDRFQYAVQFYKI